jgi:UDP-GlcNAc:undecaprenyl-phosphate GlcNAc-1-phosphate transferase
MTKYLLPFLLSFLSSVFLLAFAVYISRKKSWSGRVSERHIHGKGVSRFGGVIMILVFNAAILLNQDLFKTPELYGVMIASIALLLFGLWDDIREIFWQFQLFFQVALAAFIFIIGVRIFYITNFLTGGIWKIDSGPVVIVSLFLVLTWIVLLINAINWLDGLDGLSGGVSLISAATILTLSFHSDVNQPPVAIICAIFMGTILAFLIFNFYPSRILAGTSGAMFMGFILAILAIFAGTKIATALLVAAIPIFDSVWVIFERLKEKKSIFRPDKRHLHYKLLALGWSQRKIAAYYYVVTLAIAIVALNTKYIGKTVTLSLILIFMSGIYFYINKKTKMQKYEKNG